MTITEQLRQAIDECGVLRAAIARHTGVTEATLSRFMAGQAMKSPQMDILAAFLGLELIRVTPPAGRRQILTEAEELALIAKAKDHGIKPATPAKKKAKAPRRKKQRTR